MTLTIDSDLQFLTHEELKVTIEKYNAKEGSALIMDPKTGEILAMTTYPDFDPNNIDQLGNIEYTKNKVDCKDCIDMILFCKSIDKRTLKL